MLNGNTAGAPWGATADDWNHFAQGLQLLPDLLPVVSNPGGKISPASKLRDLGKTPSRYDAHGQVVGIPKWTQHRATDRDVGRWSQHSDLGICLQTREVRAIDIDVADPARAAAVQELIGLMVELPARRRANSGKCLLAFRMPGDFAKRVIRTADGIIEFLATGQQCVVVGTHPSGVRYAWNGTQHGGLPDAIPELTPAEFECLWQALVNAFALTGTDTRERNGMVPTVPRVAGDLRDPTVAWLDENGWVTGYERDGRVDVRCPWGDGHSTDSGPSSSSYFPAGVGGFAQGHYRCLHASCAGRTDGDFFEAVGYLQSDFEVEEPAPAAQASDAALRIGVALPAVMVDGATGEETLLVSPTFSDDHLALKFAERAQGFLRVTPGLGWMGYDGWCWQADKALRRVDLARSMCRDAAALAERVNEQRQLASSRTVTAVMNLAQSDRRLYVPATDWDADPFALNTPAGVVDLRTGALRPRTGDLVTKVTSVAPDASAACPHWLGFLDAVCGGDAELIGFLQRMLGYMLTGDRREQKLFFIWGTGSNGKSTLSDLLMALLGDYGLKLSSTVLMQSTHDRHPTELAQLHSVRAAVSSELEEGQFFNEARVKELTGDATLSARFMGKDFFTFPITHKHLIVGNHKPRLKGGDPALARRLVLVPFRAAFSGAKADPEMPAKLRAEGAAILAWLIRGAVAWASDGLGIPPAVRAASEEYMADHNDIELWVEDCCERGTQWREKASALYSSFRLWKESRGERAPSQVTWAERMSLIAGIRKIRSNGMQYEGVRLPGFEGHEHA